MKNEMLIENLTKASHDAIFCANSLRDALTKGSSVDSLLIIPMIGRAAELSRDIEHMMNAIGAGRVRTGGGAG